MFNPEDHLCRHWTTQSYIMFVRELYFESLTGRCILSFSPDWHWRVDESQFVVLLTVWFITFTFITFICVKDLCFVFYFDGLWVVTVNNSMMFKWVAVKQLWGSGGGSDPFTSHSFMKRKHRPDSGCVLSSALTSDLLFHSSSFLWSVKFSFQFIEMSEFIKNW